MKNLIGLTKEEKRVAAKALMDNGYTARKVEEILGIDYSTATLYAKKEVPEEMEEFSTLFNNYIREQKQKGLGLVHKRLLELIPKERRIDQVIKAGEFYEGRNQQPPTLIQNNVVIEEGRKKYDL